MKRMLMVYVPSWREVWPNKARRISSWTEKTLKRPDGSFKKKIYS